MSPLEVIHEWSFQNVQMFGAVLPSYDSKENENSTIIDDDDDWSEADKLLGIKR